MNKKTSKWIKIMTITKKTCGCHQKPERSFFINGYQFPLCARCTGILLGYILSILLLFFEFKLSNIVCLLLLTPLIVDGSIQLLCSIMSTNKRRLITGIFFGIGIIQLIKNIIVSLYYVCF